MSEFAEEDKDRRDMDATCGRRRGAVKAPFGYFGAKQRLAAQLLAMLPPHNAWVEAFCGSAALTLAKPPAPLEVINDCDGEIINLFVQLRENSKALCRAIALTPYARAEYEEARNAEPSSDPLERARRFLVLAMMSVNGTVGDAGTGFSYSSSYSRGNREARVNRWYHLPHRLEQVVERLRSVRIENIDARELLVKFSKRPATLVYLDPPYYVKRSYGYTFDENNPEFHQALLKICQASSCMIMISGYENDLYTDLLRPEYGWVCSRIDTSTRSHTGKDFARTEVTWCNAALVEARATGRLPVELSATEQKQKKVNPER